MNKAERLFERFPDYIKNFIYENSWNSLRDVQIAAAESIFEGENNLLLSSSTASGKTEAAFFPILTELREYPSSSIAVIYIAPIKSLINDQFERLDSLLEESEIPESFKGLPVTLIAASFVSLAFFGFGGIVENLVNLIGG